MSKRSNDKNIVFLFLKLKIQFSDTEYKMTMY